MTGSVHLDLDAAVASITIDNPDKRNSFDLAMMRQLRDLAGIVADNRDIRVVLLAGAGERAFCAGADFEALTAADNILDSVNAMEDMLDQAVAAMARIEVPIVAAIRGACLGGGVQLAMTADIRIAADDLKFGIPAVSLGLVYPLDAVAKIVTLAGPGTAKHLLIGGTPYDAATAHAKRLVDEVVPAAELAMRAAAFAERIAAYPPDTVRTYKRVVDRFAAGAEIDAIEEMRSRANRAGELIDRLAQVRRARRRKTAAA